MRYLKREFNISWEGKVRANSTKKRTVGEYKLFVESWRVRVSRDVRDKIFYRLASNPLAISAKYSREGAGNLSRPSEN